MKKNIFRIVKIVSFILLSFSFISCFPKDDGIADKVNIVSTIFPEYDWVQQIIGNSANVTNSLVIKNGVDMHSFQPSASDIVQIHSCDIFIYVGGISDEWVSEVLEQRTNKDMKIIKLMDLIEAKEEGEAIQSEEEEEETELDEHVWLSINNPITFVKAISAAIIEKDPENAEYYQKKTDNYLSELAGIRDGYKMIASGAENSTLIFCDRFPFRYLMDELNLNYIAAFPGCSSENQASFETIAALTQAVKDYNVKALIKLENSTDKLAQSVMANSKYCDVITLDSMQSVTLRQAFNGKTFAQFMRTNLEELRKVLK